MSNTKSHPDSRDMEFRTDGSILECDDGGIAMRTNPSDSTGDWFGLCGNMQVFEPHNVTYEPIFNSVLFGTMDNGSIEGTLGIAGTYTHVLGGDGSECFIDYSSDPNKIYKYQGSQDLDDVTRRTQDKMTGSEQEIAKSLNTGNAAFVAVGAMNPSGRKEFAIATNHTKTNGNATRNFVAFTFDH